MSKSNTHKPVEQLNCQKTNVPVPPSTGVNSCTDASRSQPRSNTKKNSILPAKSVNMKKVKEHPRTIKSSLKTTNRVDSSISSKHTVINLNSHYVCQTCNKCLISANHDMCVVTYLHSENASPSVKNVMRKVKQVWKPKQGKQVWKPTGNILTTVGYQWMPTGRTFTLGAQCPLTRLTKPNKVSAIAYANPREPNHNWGSNFPNSPSLSVFKWDRSRLRNFVKKFIRMVRFGNDHFGAIMGYRDYVIGESVISRVKFLRSKDETPEVVIKFLKQIQIGLNKTVRNIHTDNGTEFVNKDLTDYYERVGIFHQKTVPGTPQQHSIIERRNHTLVEAAKIMLIFSKALMFLWPEVVATAWRIPNSVPAAPYIPPTNKELDILFQPMFDEYMEPPRVERPVSPAPTVSVPVNSAGTPSSTTIDQDAPSPCHSPSSSAIQSPSLHTGVAADSTLMEDNPFAPVDNPPFINVFAPEPSSEASSSGDLSSAESPYVSQTLHHLEK
ncbi:retrovirus-related pol polyprotein from transposon TNT 1-94 [Tanacetum coccineum]